MKVKRFLAFFKDDKKNNHLYKDGKEYATEARFDIVAEDEDEALEMIKKEGYNPDDFYLDETGGVKDPGGHYFKKSITDARL